MKGFVFAALMTLLLAVPAHAQGSKLKGGKSPPSQSQTDDNKVRPNEEDYKSALDRMPAKNQPSDPWRNVRERPKQK